MKLNRNGKIVLRGMEFDNILDSIPLSKRLGQYREWKETQKTSFRAVWLDRYNARDGSTVDYEAHELKISNRGKCFLDDIELRESDDISTARDIFSQITFS